MLDGASSVRHQAHDGGWYAERLGLLVQRALAEEPNADLVQTLRAAISVVADQTNPDDEPTSTISIARWHGERVDLLVLGDSPAVVFRRSQPPLVLEDRRLDTVAGHIVAEYQSRLALGLGFDYEHQALRAQLQKRQRLARNKPSGYWIAGMAPEAAEHAITRTVKVDDVSALLLVTDGVADFVTTGQIRWHELRRRLQTAGVPATLAELHERERSDPDGKERPRSKVHDDKTVALVSFLQVRT